MKRILFAWYALGAVCGIMMIVVSLTLMIIEPKAEWLLWFILADSEHRSLFVACSSAARLIIRVIIGQADRHNVSGVKVAHYPVFHLLSRQSSFACAYVLVG